MIGMLLVAFSPGGSKIKIVLDVSSGQHMRVLDRAGRK